MCFRIEGTVVTHVGRVRSNNEDNYYLFGSYRYNTELQQYKEIKRVCLGQETVAVFDGMGGENAGEVASLIAAKVYSPCGREHMLEEMICQMKAANEKICGEMRKSSVGRMGTTAVALYMDSNMAMCCNVGDSRCYLMRNGILRQLSVDHSEARQMIEMGILSPEKARRSKSWHKLTQHLGIFPEEFVIEPYISEEIILQNGDIFLLCSDGLTDMVMDEEIQMILGKEQSAECMADELTQTALAYGGKDNITAMVLQVKEEEIGQKINDKSKVFVKILKSIGVLLICALVSAILVLLNYQKEHVQNRTVEEEDAVIVDEQELSVSDVENAKEKEE